MQGDADAAITQQQTQPRSRLRSHWRSLVRLRVRRRGLQRWRGPPVQEQGRCAWQWGSASAVGFGGVQSKRAWPVVVSDANCKYDYDVLHFLVT